MTGQEAGSRCPSAVPEVLRLHRTTPGGGREGVRGLGWGALVRENPEVKRRKIN